MEDYWTKLYMGIFKTVLRVYMVSTALRLDGLLVISKGLVKI